MMAEIGSSKNYRNNVKSGASTNILIKCMCGGLDKSDDVSNRPYGQIFLCLEENRFRVRPTL